jgi:hypothetical protein
VESPDEAGAELLYRRILPLFANSLVALVVMFAASGRNRRAGGRGGAAGVFLAGAPDCGIGWHRGALPLQTLARNLSKPDCDSAVVIKAFVRRRPQDPPKPTSSERCRPCPAPDARLRDGLKPSPRQIGGRRYPGGLPGARPLNVHQTIMIPHPAFITLHLSSLHRIYDG